MENEKRVIAMYDVRGIQKYIYRTPKVRDAIGASYIVENIIEDALEDALCNIKNNGIKENGEKLIVNANKEDLKWCNWETEEVFLYDETEEKDIQVLFIGGGNACVSYSSRSLCLAINRLMSKYVLEHSYSFQLAIAICEKGENYADDYKRLQKEMVDTKANMVVTKPLGALAIMQVELRSGYPVTVLSSEDSLKIPYQEVKKPKSKETILKLKAYEKKKKEKNLNQEELAFDNLISKKGEDSNLAVIHIDGNSMALRIRGLIENIPDYSDAVNKMRKISFQITNSYRKVFNEMHDYFTEEGKKKAAFSGKKSEYFIREILVAGDDITYVCNAGIALETVEYYCKEISGYTMNGKSDVDSILHYGFSVCAGIAFIGSHFPFYIGYEVAESCCSIAKDRAKKKECMDHNPDRVGNFVDFQICKNIQARDLKEMRKREYITRSGEQLLIRPYYIHAEKMNVRDKENNFTKNNAKLYSFEKLKQQIRYFQSEECIPRSFAKQLRNIYPQGQNKAEFFNSFLKSRNWTMPQGETKLYYENEKGEKIAKWYDALEMMDYYIDMEIEEEKEKEELLHGELSN